ncbi:MAG: VOC family protein [Pseudonocardiaceae bacterium]
MFRGIRTIMVFALDPEKSARWWADVLDAEVKLDADGDSVYAWFESNGIEYGWHPAEDQRNARGGSPVVYWAVDDLATAREQLLIAGCTHQRGPLRVDERRQICQLIDPFGTVIGLDGP